MGGYIHALHLATEIRGHEIVLHQLRAHTNGVCRGQVTLVDCHYNGLACCLGVHNGLLGLGHNAIVGGNNKYHNIRYVGTTGAHLGKDGVAGSVNERKQAAVVVYGVCADVLSNATGLTGYHLSAANVVEQGCFAVVHVPHHSYDGGAYLEGILGLFFNGYGFGLFHYLYRGFNTGTFFTLHTLVHKAVFLAKGCHLVTVQRGGGVGKYPHGQKLCNELKRFNAHRCSKVCNRYGGFYINGAAGCCGGRGLLSLGGGGRLSLRLGLFCRFGSRLCCGLRYRFLLLFGLSLGLQ